MSFEFRPRPFAQAPDARRHVELLSMSVTLAELRRAVVDGDGLVVVTGPPGVGKSHLACVLADQLQNPPFAAASTENSPVDSEHTSQPTGDESSTDANAYLGEACRDEVVEEISVDRSTSAVAVNEHDIEEHHTGQDHAGKHSTHENNIQSPAVAADGESSTRDVAQHRFRAVVISSAGLTTRRAALQAVLHGLDVPFVGLSEQEARLRLLDRAREFAANDQPLVIVLDEANNVSDRILEDLRALTNFVFEGEPVIRVVLIGQTAFEERLGTSALEAVNHRITCQLTITTLSTSESMQYVNERMAHSGLAASEHFERAAIEELCQIAAGLPRAINLLAEKCLELVTPDQLSNDHETRNTNPASEQDVDESDACASGLDAADEPATHPTLVTRDIVRQAHSTLETLPLPWRRPLVIDEVSWKSGEGDVDLSAFEPLGGEVVEVGSIDRRGPILDPPSNAQPIGPLRRFQEVFDSEAERDSAFATISQFVHGLNQPGTTESDTDHESHASATDVVESETADSNAEEPNAAQDAAIASESVSSQSVELKESESEHACHDDGPRASAIEQSVESLSPTLSESDDDPTLSLNEAADQAPAPPAVDDDTSAEPKLEDDRDEVGLEAGEPQGTASDEQDTPHDHAVSQDEPASTLDAREDAGFEDISAFADTLPAPPEDDERLDQYDASDAAQTDAAHNDAETDHETHADRPLSALSDEQNNVERNASEQGSVEHNACERESNAPEKRDRAISAAKYIDAVEPLITQELPADADVENLELLLDASPTSRERGDRAGTEEALGAQALNLVAEVRSSVHLPTPLDQTNQDHPSFAFESFDLETSDDEPDHHSSIADASQTGNHSSSSEAAPPSDDPDSNAPASKPHHIKNDKANLKQTSTDKSASSSDLDDTAWREIRHEDAPRQAAVVDPMPTANRVDKHFEPPEPQKRRLRGLFTRLREKRSI